MKRFLGRFVVIGLLVVAGIWLSARGVAPAPESSARLAALRGLAAPGRPTAPGSDAPVPTGGTVNPVSYTHLRAHETVLDLVCRLLLAKKQNKTKKKTKHTQHIT